MDDLTKELQAINSADQNELAQSLAEIKELANQAYEADQRAKEAEAAAKELKNKLSALMESAGVDKITADNCTVSGKIKNSVSVPKDLPSKYELFKYIEANYGKEVLDEMLTINARSFSSWYDKEVEAQVQKGNVDFKLSMLSPYERFSITYRKRRA
jgi:DNA repair exonuclease SbcCD ATPase subunit